MKIIVDFLRSDVKIKTSHLWMVGLGIVIGLGFAINCAIAPFVPLCDPIDNEQLILAASIVAGLGTARQVVLMKFKYLSDLKPFSESDSGKTTEEILKERVWVPAVGWCLVVGFAVNMLIIPFFHDIRPVEWSFLQSSIGIFLTISGAREYGIYSQQNETRSKKAAEKSEE
ncbi:MAG: hypothetical protein IKN71_08410 [Alphaproteobacteria bacterium]|nr:hypothetical protein [Alphaproteobacteria bacterium]